MFVAEVLPIGIPARAAGPAVEPLVMFANEDIAVLPFQLLDNPGGPVLRVRLSSGVAGHGLVVERDEQDVVVDKPVADPLLPGVTVTREVVGEHEIVGAGGTRAGHGVMVAQDVGEHVVLDEILLV